MKRDPPPVFRRCIRQDRIVAAGQAVLGFRGDADAPQVVLLVILIEHEHVVFGFLPGLLLVRFRLGRAEEDRRTVRRPSDRRNGGRMRCEGLRFPAVT